MRLTGEVTQIVPNVFGRLIWRQVLRACQHVLPLSIKPHRWANLEFRRGNRTDEHKARALPRTGRCCQDIRVEHDSHYGAPPSRAEPSPEAVSTSLISSGVRP